jgi:hypothetical protein
VLPVLKKIFLAVAVLFVVFIGVVITRPDTYHVERSKSVAAPAAVVYAHVADLRAWNAWSPWEKLDPNMKKTYEGPAQGAGASYAWQGNDDVGSGKMTVTEALPPSSVTIKLEFIEPMASVADTRFVLAPESAGTKVTWAMDGRCDFLTKAFGMFMDMDAMIGADFEKGLADLAKVAENDARRKAEEVAAAEVLRQAAEAAAAAQATATAAAAQPPANR